MAITRNYIIRLGIIISLVSIYFFMYTKEPITPQNQDTHIKNFTLQSLYDENNFREYNEIKGKYLLVNFFASWCVSCLQEHEVLNSLYKMKSDNLLVYGVNWHDKKNKALSFLQSYGDPYDFVGYDKDGVVSVNFSVIGIPESILLSPRGKIIYRHRGPLTINNRDRILEMSSKYTLG